MEEIATLKVSDLKDLLAGVTDELQKLRKEFEDYRNREELQKGYTIQQAADKIGVNYYTVRRLVILGELTPCYLKGNTGHYRITGESIKNYQDKKKNKQ